MNIQDEELNYKKEQTVSFLGLTLDTVTLVVFTLAIGFSLFLWLYFNLYNFQYNRYFLFALIFFLITQIIFSGTYVASYSIEDNEIKEVIQLNAILFSSLVILLAFGNSHFNEQDNKLLILSLFVSVLSLIYYSVPKSGGYKRFVRKLKTAFMTISIFLFMNMMFNVATRKFDLLK
jgi:hypothetical protein